MTKDDYYKFILGYYYQTTNQIDSAVLLFQELANDTKSFSEAIKELIIINEEKGDYETAKKYLLEYNQKKPDDYFSWFHLGVIKLKEGEYEKAKEYIEKAYQLNQSEISILYYLASSYYANNQYDSAIQYYTTFLNKTYPNYEVLFNLGKLYYLKNEFDTAINYLKDAIELNPLLTDAYLLLGNSYNKTGKIKEADDIFENLLKIEPSNKYAINKIIEKYNREKEEK
ncbi:MAG TPA: tetratricopeptide repeat protein, partial [bacterium]|nr:tetratricopeptide repeat protein [bacterium]